MFFRPSNTARGVKTLGATSVCSFLMSSIFTRAGNVAGVIAGILFSMQLTSIGTTTDRLRTVRSNSRCQMATGLNDLTVIMANDLFWNACGERINKDGNTSASCTEIWALHSNRLNMGLIVIHIEIPNVRSPYRRHLGSPAVLGRPTCVPTRAAPL